MNPEEPYEMVDIDHVCYSVSYKDLVKSWVLLNFKDEFAIIFWNAKQHIEILKSIGLFFFEVELYDAEILVLQASSLDDTAILCNEIIKLTGRPYFQVWGLGKYLFDSIDIEEFET